MPHQRVVKNGKDIPSVTQIIGVIHKPFLERWRGKLGNVECDRILRESSDIGTDVHNAIQAYLEKRPLEMSLKDYTDAFSKWHVNSGFEHLLLEPGEPLYSDIYKFQGTYDAIGRVNGELCVFDWKTSSRIEDTMGLQLAAYAYLYNETIGADKPILTGWIVRIDKKTKKLETREFRDLPRYFEIFKSLIPVWYFLND